MKNKINLMLITAICWQLTSCEGPRDRRRVALGKSNQTSDLENNINGTNFNSSNNLNFSNTGENGQNTTNTNSQITNLPAEFSHCQTNLTTYTNYHKLIGEFSICKSKQTGSNKILFQAKQTIQDSRVCFFPTNAESSAGSVMIGNAQCLSAVAGRIDYMTLNINRPGFTNKIMNGVIIVKDLPYGEVTPYHNTITSSSPTYVHAYEDCMIYLYNTGDRYACERFKIKGNYIYVNF